MTSAIEIAKVIRPHIQNNRCLLENNLREAYDLSKLPHSNWNDQPVLCHSGLSLVALKNNDDL